MRFRLNLLSLCAVVVGLCPAAGAQAVADTLRLSIQEAVCRAVAEDPDLDLLRAQSAAAQSAIGLARRDGSRLPEVALSVSPSQRYGLAFDQTAGQLGRQTTEALDASVFASSTLYDGGRARARTRQAEAEAAASRTDQDVRVLDASAETLQDLRRAARAQDRAPVLRRDLDQLRRLEAVLADGVRAGIRDGSDLLALRLRIADVELAAAQTEVDRHAAETDLRIRLGVSDARVVRLGDRSVAAPPAVRDSSLHADVAAARARVRAARAAVEVARAEGGPSLRVTARLGTGYSSLGTRLALDASGAPVIDTPGVPATVGGEPVLVGDDPLLLGESLAFERTPLPTQFADNWGGSVQLTLSIPLFDHGRRSREIERLELTTRVAEQVQATVARRVREDVRRARAALASTSQVVAPAEARAQAAEDYYAAVRDRYTLGASDVRELLDAQQNALTSRIEVQTAMRDVEFAQAQVWIAEGQRVACAP